MAKTEFCRKLRLTENPALRTGVRKHDSVPAHDCLALRLGLMRVGVGILQQTAQFRVCVALLATGGAGGIAFPAAFIEYNDDRYLDVFP
jgi:hypothetical protein